MSLRTRPTPSKQTSISDATTSTAASTAANDNEPETLKSPPPPPPSSLSQRAISQTLARTANLLAVSCLVACFTDSFKSPEGQVYYGLATFKGMWLFDYPYTSSSTSYSSTLPDLSKYKLRFIDGVDAVLSVFVFVAVALRDKNVVSCFCPQPGYEIQGVLDIVPVGIGLICSLLFVVFPTRRHGIGYPVTPGK